MIAILAATISLAQAVAGSPAPKAVVLTPPAAISATTQVPKANRDAVICHNEAVLGTHFTKKVCLSAAQADDRSQQDQTDLQRMQSLSH